MPHGLKRFQQSAQSHFVTFTCYHRRRGFDSPAVCDLFVQVVEEMRCRFGLCIYGYVVMPEHVHLLLNEPAAPRLTPQGGREPGPPSPRRQQSAEPYPIL
jgi:REP element-mobilizing transposase RayT